MHKIFMHLAWDHGTNIALEWVSDQRLKWKYVHYAQKLTNFSQYASSHGCRAYCYAELAISSPAVAKTTASMVLIAPTHREMARLSGSEWPGKYRDGRPAKGYHQSQY